MKRCLESILGSGGERQCDKVHWYHRQGTLESHSGQQSLWSPLHQPPNPDLGPPRSLPRKVTCGSGASGPWHGSGGPGRLPCLSRSRELLSLPPWNALVLARLWKIPAAPRGLLGWAGLKAQPQDATPVLTTSGHEVRAAGPRVTPAELPPPPH